MSDVGINLDGLTALFAAIVLGGVLLSALVICTAIAWYRSRGTRGAISARPIYRHLVGMFACFIACAVVGLIIIVRDGGRYSHELERWFDRYLFLWMPAMFLLWPMSVVMIKKWQSSRIH